MVRVLSVLLLLFLSTSVSVVTAEAPPVRTTGFLVNDETRQCTNYLLPHSPSEECTLPDGWYVAHDEPMLCLQLDENDPPCRTYDDVYSQHCPEGYEILPYKTIDIECRWIDNRTWLEKAIVEAAPALFFGTILLLPLAAILIIYLFLNSLRHMRKKHK